MRARTKREQQAALLETGRYKLYDWLVVCPTNHRLVTLISTPMQPGYCPVCGQPARDVQRARV